MPSVFVSYSRKDVEIVRKIVEALAKEKIDTWIDWENISPASDWLTEIYKGIESSDAFLYVLSPASIQSRECGAELEYALKNGKRLIPVVVRNLDTGEKVPPELASRNWIFIREDDDFETGLNNVINTLRTDYEWIKFHTELLVRALEWERKDRSEGYLLQGAELMDAERAFAASINKEPRLLSVQALFILASRQSSLRKQRRLVVSTTFLSVVFCLVGIVLGRYVAVPLQSGSAISSGILAIGGIVVLAVGGLAGYLSRDFFTQEPAPKSEPPNQSAEEPDALLSETVFISYKRTDWEEHVKPLVLRLRENGYKVWIDQKNLELSENWMDKINEALKVCQRLVLCVSPDALDSKYVKMEYRYFLHHEKTIFPVILMKAEMPAELLQLQSTPFAQLGVLTEKLRDAGRAER